MPRRCWVPNCSNNCSEPPGNPKLFLFPRDTEKCIRWLKAIGDPTLASCRWSTLVSGRYVCIKHFLPRMISAAKRPLCNALPILFTDERPVLPDRMLRIFLESTPEYFARVASCAEDVTGKSPGTFLSTSCDPTPHSEVDKGRATVLRFSSAKPVPDAGVYNGQATVKQEPDEFLEDPEPNEDHEPNTWKRAMMKEENEEVLESPAAVFLDFKVDLKEESLEECVSQEIHKPISLKRELGKENDEEGHEPNTWKRAMMKEENEEVLESPAAVFLDFKVDMKEGSLEECESQEIHKPISLKRELGKENDEELEPIASVFLDPEEAVKEVTEEYQDPLATCSENVSIATVDHSYCRTIATADGVPWRYHGGFTAAESWSQEFAWFRHS